MHSKQLLVLIGNYINQSLATKDIVGLVPSRSRPALRNLSYKIHLSCCFQIHEKINFETFALLHRQVEIIRVVQPREEKALGRPYSNLSITKKAYWRTGEGLLARACSDGTKR